MKQQSDHQEIQVDDLAAGIRAHMLHLDETGENIRPELLSLLGCLHQNNGVFVHAREITPWQAVEHAELIGDALLTINAMVAGDLEEPVCPVPSVLSGISNEVWRRSILKESTAYDLAAVTLAYLQGYSKYYTLDLYAAKRVCIFLNAWLQPVDKWNTLPSAEEVAEAIFGAAWVSLRLPDASKSIARIVYLERPPFKPDIFAGQKLESGRTLPELECKP